MDHPRPWLKYVDASDLFNAANPRSRSFEGVKVESAAGEPLGKVDAFIVDEERAQPCYLVVDAGGWFRSKQYLLPIGLTRLDTTRDVLVAANLARERIERLPGFDVGEFDALTDEGIRHFNDATSRALSDSLTTFDDTAHFSAAWRRPEFRTPDWWPGMPAPASRPQARPRAVRTETSAADPMGPTSREESGAPPSVRSSRS